MTQHVVVLSDIHANRSALHAVFNEIGKIGVDEIWFLGDLYGYFARPQYIYDDLVNRAPCLLTCQVAGNNDWHVVGKLPLGLEPLRPGVKRVLMDHADTIREIPEARAWLESLPVLASPLPGVYLAHGAFTSVESNCVNTYCDESARPGHITPRDNWRSLCQLLRDPPQWVEKSLGGSTAAPSLMLVGHTHQRGLWRPNSRATWEKLDPVPSFNGYEPISWHSDEFPLSPEQPLLINPGSVGLPRYNGYRLANNYGWAEFVLIELLDGGIQIQFRGVPYVATEECKQLRVLDDYRWVFDMLHRKQSWIKELY